MKVLSAIGRFFARIGRWIKETAWIQPLLIVGAIFAVIFAIPHIINGVKGWFNDSDSTNAFYAQYRLSLSGADNIKTGEDVGSSEVDKFFTYLADSSKEEDLIKMVGKERFFVAFVTEDNSTCKDLYGGFKMLQDKWTSKNDEFSMLEGEFKLLTIYTDSISTVDDETNLFDTVWSNHYELFEDFTRTGYLEKTAYAQNKKYSTENYISSFIGNDDTKTCPMKAPLVMFFDYTDANLIKVNDQKIRGLSDVIFSVDGSSDLEKARTLRDCWAHRDIFKEYKNN